MLNLFNVADRDEYLAYSRRSAKEVQAHGGRVVALGKFREAEAGDIKPRTVMRRTCPARHPSTKKSPFPRIATTASSPCSETTVIFTLPL
jgi:hypothetical protein